MSWRQCMKNQKISIEKDDKDSATDGDMDIIYCLFLASIKWNQPEYNELAQKSLDGFAKCCVN